MNNVVTVIPGAKHPEETVLLGGHYDGWTYGTDDNTSAWSSIVQVGRGLGRLLKRGWQPDRTIVLVGWDGEEYGLLGSTEWVEQLRPDLRRNAIAYINMDGVGGREFSAGAVPSLDDLIRDVSKTVPAPGAPGTVFESWTAGGEEPSVDRLGSGSDYTAFLDHVGVPSLEVGFSTPGGEYHTSYDDTQMMERFLDPGYLGHQAASRMSGTIALRLANADALPFRYSAYAAAVATYVEELQAMEGAEIVDLAPLLAQAQAWGEAATALEAARRRAGGLRRDRHPARPAPAAAHQPLLQAPGARAHSVRGPGRASVVQAHDLRARAADRLRGAVPARAGGRDQRRRCGHGRALPRPDTRVAPAGYRAGGAAGLGRVRRLAPGLAADRSQRFRRRVRRPL